MGSNIAFYGSEIDTKSLQDFAVAIGLHMVAPTIDGEISGAIENGPYCFLSVAPVSELHPYGTPPINVSDATDPLIGFMRPYFKNPYLVLGHLYKSNDVRELESQTKSYYQKLVKWIKANWVKHGDFYLGPEANKLLKSGAKLVNALPNTFTTEVINV